MLLKQCNDSLFYCFVGKQIWKKKDFYKKKSNILEQFTQM